LDTKHQRQRTQQCIKLCEQDALLQDGDIHIEDGLEETSDHKTRIRHFMVERVLSFGQTKLVRARKVGIGSSDNAVVVDHNELHVGDLRLRVFEDAA
jgi:hypothetical protein